MQIVKVCNELDVPFLPRGAGTSLAGGCLPVGGGVMIALTRMKRILEVDYRNRYAVVEPGVVNLWLTNHLKPHGYHFAPDPSSQGACTIGGNVATNSGGPHTLKYGVTVNHVLGVEFVLPDGRVVQTGGPAEDNPGYDLTGVIVGSEGTFGIVTQGLGAHHAQPRGVSHAARRLRDGGRRHQHHQRHHRRRHRSRPPWRCSTSSSCRRSRRRSTSASRSTPGRCSSWRWTAWKPGLDADAERITAIAKKNNAREVRRANTDAERLLLWKSPQAGVRRRRPAGAELLHAGRRRAAHQAAAHPARHPARSAQKYDLRICNVFHAGDGNIHPILLFDERDADQVQARAGGQPRDPRRVHPPAAAASPASTASASRRSTSCRSCSRRKTWRMMLRLRTAFNPDNRCSPRKMLPTAGACIEPSKAGRRAAL